MLETTSWPTSNLVLSTMESSTWRSRAQSSLDLTTSETTGSLETTRRMLDSEQLVPTEMVVVVTVGQEAVGAAAVVVGTEELVVLGVVPVEPLEEVTVVGMPSGMAWLRCGARRLGSFSTPCCFTSSRAGPRSLRVGSNMSPESMSTPDSNHQSHHLSSLSQHYYYWLSNYINFIILARTFTLHLVNKIYTKLVL